MLVSKSFTIDYNIWLKNKSRSAPARNNGIWPGFIFLTLNWKLFLIDPPLSLSLPLPKIHYSIFVRISQARRLEQEDRLIELVDVTVSSFPQNDVLRCIRIGLLCCQENVQNRPMMSSAFIMLIDTDDLATLPPAGRLGFQDRRDNTIIENAGINPATCTSNSITVSLASGR